MRQRVCLWAVIALVVSGGWTRAEAQTPPEGWDVVVAPYLMGAAMDGATTLRGQAVDIDLSASDIFSNLQFGAMGLVVARKGNWGFGGDAIWMALGTTVRNTNVDFNQGAFAFYGLRRLGRAADLTVGLRVNTLQGNFEFKPLNTAVSQDRTWVDPVVGVILRTPGERPVHLRLYGEVGGFGAGSDISWQVFPVVGSGWATACRWRSGTAGSTSTTRRARDGRSSHGTCSPRGRSAGWRSGIDRNASPTA